MLPGIEVLDGAQDHGAHQVGVGFLLEGAVIDALTDAGEQHACRVADHFARLGLDEIPVGLEMEHDEVGVLRVLLIGGDIALNDGPQLRFGAAQEGQDLLGFPDGLLSDVLRDGEQKLFLCS